MSSDPASGSQGTGVGSSASSSNVAKGKNLAMMQQLFEKQLHQTQDGAVPNPLKSEDAAVENTTNYSSDERIASPSGSSSTAQVYGNRPGKSADQLMAALSRMQQDKKSEPDAAVAMSVEPSKSSPSGSSTDTVNTLAKSKGKNFDQMVKANANYVPMQTPLETEYTYPPVPTIQVAATKTTRGKDFQAMVQRAPEDMLHSMPYASSVGPTPTPSHIIPGAHPRMNTSPYTHSLNGPVSFYGFPPHATTAAAAVPQTHPLYPHSMQHHVMGPPLPQPSPKPKPKKVKTSKPTSMDANIFVRNPSHSTEYASMESKSSSTWIGPKLSTLLTSIDPTGMYVLQEETEEQILYLVSDFINSVVQSSMKLAKHRCSSSSGDKQSGHNNNNNTAVVNVQDVALALKKGWGMTVPGFSPMVDIPPLLGSGPGTRILNQNVVKNPPTTTSVASVQKKARDLALAQSGQGQGVLGVQTSPMQSSQGMKRPAES